MKYPGAGTGRISRNRTHVVFGNKNKWNRVMCYLECDSKEHIEEKKFYLWFKSRSCSLMERGRVGLAFRHDTSYTELPIQ